MSHVLLPLPTRRAGEPRPAVAAPIAAAVRTYFRAMLLGDRELLRGVVLPDHDLGGLVVQPNARPPIARLLAETDRLVVSCRGQAADRQHVVVRLGGELHRLVVHLTPHGPRIDPRPAAAALAETADPAPLR